MNTNTLPATILAAKEKFELACKDASALQIVSNFGAAFTAVNVIALLREAMTDEIMDKVFMPLMNTKIGFLTDRNGRARSGGRAPLPLYTRDIVRDCIIDAVTIGLLPTGNQFNIIAERMYPTKEGYTSLLRKLGVKYFIDTSYDKGQTQNFAEIPCKINYEYNGEKNGFSIIATVKKDDYSSHDQLRGKAERKAKKALYEYITGCDFGDSDEQSSVPIVDAVAEEIKEEANAAPTIGVIDGQPIQAQQGQTAQSEPANPPQAREGRGSNNAKPLF
ncbi:hypothetical protein [Bacteroides thetaiotaomicron]|uniref:hypothetical protein n=1 Tax=Bacteroides thetaiotaomicron TaxID=818 RepID=UPI0021668E51|nr:hypothetical protein [Bacteroides thetaiotaomicron]MCS2720856.1 hypothetical protein [Bacteroides thetaiotaomicron]